MKQSAVEQAIERFNRAKIATSKLAASKSFEESESAWADFLLAASGVYSKLEQGAKSTGKSTAWFGRKKHDRKKDQLLSYIHHARTPKNMASHR